MSERKVAKIFQNGGSQAVRLPAEFRFDTDEVSIWRDEATGNVVLSTDHHRNGMKELLDYCLAHPISDEEWSVFEDALAEIGESELPYDDSEVLSLFETES